MFRFFLLITLGFAVYGVGMKLSRLHMEEEQVMPFAQLEPAIIDVITLGHKGLYSDFSYFWLLQSLIYENEGEQTAEELFRKIMLITRHHPQIESLYTLSCFVMIKDFGNVEYCEEIAKEGMKALPNSWYIPAVVGYAFAFIVEDPVKASFYYKKTEDLPRSPDYLKKLGERLLKGVVEKEEGGKALRSIIENTEDPDYKDFLIRFFSDGSSK